MARRRDRWPHCLSTARTSPRTRRSSAASAPWSSASATRTWRAPRPAAGPSPSSLAHVAFWDQRILFWLDRWEHGEAPRALEQADVDWINDAGKPLCLALPPRVAARLTVEIAEEVDRRLAALTDERIAANQAAGEPLLLTRAHHRKTHLDEIERVLR